MEKIFKDHCGPDVKYLSHERIFREIKIQYAIPSIDPERIFTIRVTPGNGLQTSIYRAMLRAADSARNHAYHATGKLAADTKQLLQGKLVDEHPRSEP